MAVLLTYLLEEEKLNLTFLKTPSLPTLRVVFQASQSSTVPVVRSAEETKKFGCGLL